jgi:hypothetical protein
MSITNYRHFQGGTAMAIFAPTFVNYIVATSIESRAERDSKLASYPAVRNQMSREHNGSVQRGVGFKWSCFGH